MKRRIRKDIVYLLSLLKYIKYQKSEGKRSPMSVLVVGDDEHEAVSPIDLP
jgi:hypothetical protein